MTRFEQLIQRLASDDQFFELLEQTDNLPANEVIESLAREFRQVVERYRSLSAFAAEAKRTARAHLERDIEEQTPKRKPEQFGTDVVAPSFHLKPVAIRLPSVEGKIVVPSNDERKAIEAKKKSLRKELETIDQMIHLEIERDWDNRATEIRDHILRLKNSQQFLRDCLEEVSAKEVEEEVIQVEEQPIEAEIEIEDDDVLYLHAVGISGESASGVAHVSGEAKGIDGRNPLCRIERDGVQLIFSKMQQDYLTVTKSGILLLSTKESLQLRQAHEEISNNLKKETAVLPFRFGTVVRGKTEFDERITRIQQEFNERVARELQSAQWSVRAFALDKHVSEVLRKTMRETKINERGRQYPGRAKRLDIKVLERMLQKEKSIAESLHSELAELAKSASVISMVSFASGSSEDWKLILHGVYELADKDERANFFAAVCKLQNEYREQGVMLEVTGEAERISFVNVASDQEISA